MPPTDPRGYMDYETGRVRNFHPGLAADPAERGCRAKPPDTYFPALEQLDAVLAALPPARRVRDPDAAGLPDHAAAPRHADRRRPARLQGGTGAPGRRRARAADFWTTWSTGRSAATRKISWTSEHYRMNIARLIEARIAALLDAGAQAGIGR